MKARLPGGLSRVLALRLVAEVLDAHAVDIEAPIACGEVAVYPGDWIVGDAEGVVVIPRHLVEEIAAEAVAMTRFEDYVDGEVAKGRSIVGLYPPDARTRAEYEATRKPKD